MWGGGFFGGIGVADLGGIGTVDLGRDLELGVADLREAWAVDLEWGLERLKKSPLAGGFVKA